MATNQYFTQGVKAEQNLYEDLIIETLKIYGQDVYYIPRDIVNRDRIFQDDSMSRFDNAYRIEMYIENLEGFDGDGDLFSKFGVEIRDAATFIVSRRRWGAAVARYENTEDNPFYRPREGDLIFMAQSQTFFEITRVETQQPFYQMKDLPTFKMRCEMFEYNDEDFDTGVAVIDNVETLHSYQTILSIPAGTYDFEMNEEVRQDNTSFTMVGEVTDFNDSDMLLYVSHSGATDGEYHEWTTTGLVVGQVNNSSFIPSLINENLQEESQNTDFDVVGDGFIDFSEDNPFGDPR
tara:strand:- start:1858 stop:2733 length:876 start_codon:yes stop_codon:yes gene_type:complete